MICWNANIERNEVSIISAQCLTTSKWNSKGCDTEGAWIMNIIKDSDVGR